MFVWTGDYSEGTDSHSGTWDEADDDRRVSYLSRRMNTQGWAQPLRETTRRDDPIYDERYAAKPLYTRMKLMMTLSVTMDDQLLSPGLRTTLHMVPAIGPLTHFHGCTYLGELSCRV